VNKKSTQTMIYCGAIIYALTIEIAFAQLDKTESLRTENVAVFGTRQAYKGDFAILETPQAELIIDADVLKNAGAISLTQALDLSASVARQNNFGGLWNSFAIRGFVGDENLPSNYLVNGFNAGRGFGGPRDLSGVESVDVLKGPRAALFGRGEPGGTINLVTKRPTFEQKGELTLSAGSFDTYRADIDWDSPVSDHVAIRLVGFYEDADSFRDTIETIKQGFMPSLAWRISEQSTLNYDIEYSHQEVPFDRGVVAVGLTDEDNVLGLIPDSRFLGEPGDGPIEADVLGHQLEFQHDFNDSWSALVGLNFRDTSLEGFATENGFYGSRQFLQLDGENLTRFRRYRDYNADYQVFRAEISGSFETGDIFHRLIVGLDADKFENDQVLLRARGSSIDTTQSVEDQLEALGVSNQVINIFNPIYGAYPLPDGDLLLPNIDRLETQESVGLYIQDQISLTSKLDIRIGARFDDYEQTLDNRLTDSVNESSQSRVSPQFGVVYKVTDTLSFYGAYGENFRPLSGADADGEGFDPNESTSTEVGIKFALHDGALQGTLAIFDVDQSNISTVDAEFVATAIGEAGSQGIELDLNGHLTDTLTIWLSYAFTDAETKNAFNDANFGTVIPAGADLLNIPENQFSLQLIQDIQLAGKELNVIGGLVYVDERNGFFSDQNFTLPSYTTVRVAANYAISDSLDISFAVNNLFDKEHYTNSFADVWVQPGTPRNVSLSAAYRF